MRILVNFCINFLQLSHIVLKFRFFLLGPDTLITEILHNCMHMVVCILHFQQ